MSLSKLKELKAKVIFEIDKARDKYINISHQIHDNPEIGNQEIFASGLLSQILTSKGFTVEKGVAGYPTAFIARRRSRKASGATIGFLAEYDALPGIGHACGHNIICSASIAAAISLSEIIDDTGGEVVVLGTPAEEGGPNGSAKASFVKHNLLKDIDACMMIHPSNRTALTGKTLAVDPIDFEFIGKAAHASGFPEKGINALDGVILLFNGINALRQHLTSDVRIHGIITHGGNAPNIVPDYAKARFFIRAATRKKLDEVTKKVKAVANGAALATGVKVNMIYFQNQVDNFKINRRFNALFKEVMEGLGENVDDNTDGGLGSTDAGNVSHIVPTIQPSIKIGPCDLVPHTPEFCEAARSKQGDDGLILGAKALALTGLVLLTDDEELKRIKDEFKQDTMGEKTLSSEGFFMSKT